jgi:hypothetical protein
MTAMKYRLRERRLRFAYRFPRGACASDGKRDCHAMMHADEHT